MTAARKAKTLFLEEYERVDLKAVLEDENRFYECLDQEPEVKDLKNDGQTLKEYRHGNTKDTSSTSSFNSVDSLEGDS